MEKGNLLFELKKPEYSYLIGFMQTDGHLQSSSRNRGRLSIEINKKDIDIIEKFRKIIPVNSTMYERTRKTNFSSGHTSITMNVFDLNFRNTINYYGVPYGKKSNIIKPPPCAYSEIDYWRGIIDGDGSLGITGTGLPYLSLVTASENLYQSYKEWLQKYNINISVNRNTRDNVYNVTLFIERAQTIIDILYSNSCIYLERKKILAEEAMQWIRPVGMKIKPMQPKWTDEEICILKNNDVNSSKMLLPHRTLDAIKVKKYKINKLK